MLGAVLLLLLFSHVVRTECNRVQLKEGERERENIKAARQGGKEFIDSRNCPDFPLLRDYPNCTPFSTIDKTNSSLSPCPWLFPLLSSHSLPPLPSRALSMRSSLPRCLKIGRHEKIQHPPRALPFSFTVTLFAVHGPLAPLSYDFALGSRSKKTRRPKFETCAEPGDIVSHCASLRSPSGCNL